MHSGINSQNILLVLLVILILGSFYLGKQYREVSTTLNNCEAIHDSISRQNQKLKSKIDSLGLQINLYEGQIDSLRKKRERVIIEFISLYEQIDSADSRYLISDFKGIFPESID